MVDLLPFLCLRLRVAFLCGRKVSIFYAMVKDTFAILMAGNERSLSAGQFFTDAFMVVMDVLWSLKVGLCNTAM